MTARLFDGSDESVAIAADALVRGLLVAFPTETVYGLGARADDERAVAAIFAAKGRPEHKPLIVHVRDAAQARAFCARWPKSAAALAAAFWPGPLTLVLPKSAKVNDAVSAGGATVAVRCPAHPLALKLLAALPFAIAAPSANLSGRHPPATARQVLRQLGDRVALVIDGGTTGGVPSTVVDLGEPDGRATILRAGAVPEEAIAARVELR